MILFRALRSNVHVFENGGLVDQMIKHPKKLYYKFSDGNFNIKHGEKEYALEINSKDVVSNSFTKFVADVIGCSNFGVIKKDSIQITKVDNYFIFVYNFKSNDESFEIIYDPNSLEECNYYVSVVAKYYILEDVSEEKSIDDIKDITNINSVNEIEIVNEPVSMPEPVYIAPSEPVQTIHEQSATGGMPVKDPYDTAMNDNKYDGPIMPI